MFLIAALIYSAGYYSAPIFFYDSKRSIGFLKVFFFLPEVLFVQTMFWPKSESE